MIAALPQNFRSSVRSPVRLRRGRQTGGGSRAISQLALVIMMTTASTSISTSAFAQIDRSTPPQLGPAPALKLPPITVRQLPNGIRLMIVERHELPVADFVLVVPTGAAANPSEKAGVADLMASMLTEGTTTRTSLQISDESAFLGVHLSAQSGWEATTVALNTPTAQLDSALALFADVALHPAFPADEFARLKQERLTDLLQLKDRGPDIANRAFASIVFGANHPYGLPPAGTEASVGGMSDSDISGFYKSHFVPNSATIIVVGDITPAVAEQKIGALFGEWAKGADTPVSIGALGVAPATTISIVDKPGAAQSSFRIGGVSTTRLTPDYFAIQVMNTILGGSFTSRLNQNLRETKGYTYGAGSRFELRKFPGPFSARAEIVSAMTDSALIEFMKELRHIRDTVPSAELNKAKQYLALQLPGNFESTGQVAQQLASVALYGLPLDYYNTYVAHINAVTQADVQRVATQYIDPDHLHIVIVGDRAAIEPKLKALNIAPITVRDMNGAVVQ